MTNLEKHLVYVISEQQPKYVNVSCAKTMPFSSIIYYVRGRID